MNPAYILASIIVVVLATMIAVLTLSLTGNKGDIVTVLGFAVPIIGAMIAWIQQQAHSQNVANQRNIVDKIEESKP